jgi:hypothetical protein
VDNKLHQIDLNDSSAEESHITILDLPTAPSPRVGSASVTLGGKNYLFSGRGGEAMAPIEENGALHVLDLSTAAWSILKPLHPFSPFPQARSYHAMTSDGTTSTLVVQKLAAFRICGHSTPINANGRN